MLKDVIKRNRSYRRFHEDYSVKYNTLKELVDLARLSPSAANRQPLKFMISNEPKKNAFIFRCLSWAGYLEDWLGPVKGERPSAYIIILGDLEIKDSFGCDHGIASQSILLGATERGLGGCIIASVDRKELRNLLKIPVRYEILLVLAVGKPKEKVVIDEIGEDGDIRYWRDANAVHHVPKRGIDEIIIN